MNSIEVIYDMVKKLNLYEFNFSLISHKARLNWRQEFPSFYDKIENIQSGIHFDTDKMKSIKGKDFVDSKFIERYISDEEPLLSVASLIKSPDGKEFHLPMMNLHFDYPLSLKNLNLSLEKIIGDNFVLLKTDRFYHVYSVSLMSTEEWRLWNLKFLMVDCLVSPRYIGHSLERGHNLLRINSTNQIKTITPYSLSKDENGLTDVEHFAIVKHGCQKRKDGEMYFHHIFEVQRITQNILKKIKYNFSQEDKNNMSMASILHDTIEDTNTDFEDILQLTNKSVANLVKKLSNDKRIRKDRRNAKYLKTITDSNLDVQIIKLADILSNLRSVERTGEANWKVAFGTKCFLFLKQMNHELKGLDEYNEALKIVTELIKHTD